MVERGVQIKRSLPRLILGSLLFVVAGEQENGGSVGMGRVISDGVSDGYIHDLVVLSEYPIYTGIGAQIVSTLVKKCVNGEFLDRSYC